MKLRLTLCTLVAVCLALPAAAAQEEPGLAGQLPGDTLFYIEIPDVQGIVNGVQHSALGRIYHEPDVQAFLSTLLPRIAEGWDQIRATAPDSNLPPELYRWDALTSIEAGFCIVPGPGGGEPAMCAAVALGLQGDLSAKLFDLLGKLATEAGSGEIQPGDGGPVLVLREFSGGESFKVWQRNERLVGMFQYGRIPADRLIDSPTFQQVRSRAREQNSLLYGYMDLGGFVDSMLAIMRDNAPPDAFNSLRTIMHALGMDSMGHLSFFTGWDRNWDSVADVAVTFREGGPRGVFAQPGGTLDVDLGLLDYIPDDATSFSVSNVEAGHIWDLVTRAIKDSLPPEALAQWKASGEESFDWILGEKAEIIRAGFKGFGSRSFSYSVSSGGGMPGMGPPAKGGSFGEVRDVAAVRRMLAQVMPLVQGLFEKNKEIPVGLDIKKLTIRERNDAGEIVTREGPPYYVLKVRPERLPGEMRPMAFMLASIQPTFGVTDDGWMVANLMSGSVVRKALRSGLKKPERSIRENADVKAFLNRLPEKTFAIAWSDPRPGIEAAVTGMQAMLPMVAAQIPEDKLPFDLSAMPGPDVITRNLRPSETFSYDDGGVSRSHMVGSFGAVDFFVLLGAGATVGVPMVMPMLVERKLQAGGEGREPAPARAPVAAGNDKNGLARKELQRLEGGILVFELERERLPLTLQELTVPYEHYAKGFLPSPERGLVDDPWGHPYVFAKGGPDGYRLYCVGPNGVDEQGGGDDITLSGG